MTVQDLIDRLNSIEDKSQRVIIECIGSHKVYDVKEIVRANIPSGNCPYAYYHRDNPISNCNDVSCNKCKEIFLDGMRKDIEKEVAEL